METDEQLVARARAGDTQAFGTLVVHHQPAVTGFLVSVLRDLTAAEDAAQQAFLRAFKALGSFEGRSSFRTWVMRIALNAARSELRRRALLRWVPLVGGGEDDEDGAAGLRELAAPDEREGLDRRLELDRAMKSLAPREKEVAALRLEGYSLAEIASVLEVSEGTVKSTLFEATRKMRKRLS